MHIFDRERIAGGEPAGPGRRRVARGVARAVHALTASLKLRSARLSSWSERASSEAGAVAETDTAASSRNDHGKGSQYNKHSTRADKSAAGYDHLVGIGGRPLEDQHRALFESRFRHDFGEVRVHDDPASARTAKTLQADAFAIGHDIAFAPGKLALETRKGQELMAHELAHVVQQERGQSNPVSGQSRADNERDADNAASAFVRTSDKVDVLGVSARGLALRSHGGGEGPEAVHHSEPLLRLDERSLEIFGDARNPFVVAKTQWLLNQGAWGGAQHLSGHERGHLRLIRAMLLRMAKLYPNAAPREEIVKRARNAEFFIATDQWEYPEVELIPMASCFEALGVDPAKLASRSEESLLTGGATSSEVQMRLWDTGKDAIKHIEEHVADLEHAYELGTRGTRETIPFQAPWKATSPHARLNVFEADIPEIQSDVADVRREVEQLTPGDFDPAIGEDALRAAKGYFHRRLNKITPYFTQQANLNILQRGKSEAWTRTCNVTSLALVLAGLGISPRDYSSAAATLPTIVLLERIYRGLWMGTPMTPLRDLRLPDFLQIVTIGTEFKRLASSNVSPENISKMDDATFTKTLDDARSAAANVIVTSSAFFETVAQGFGVTRETLEIGTIPSAGRARKTAETKFEKRLKTEYRETLQIELGGRPKVPVSKGGRRLGQRERKKVAREIERFPSDLRQQLVEEFIRKRGVDPTTLSRAERKRLRKEAEAAVEERLKTRIAADLWEEPEVVTVEDLRAVVMERVVPHLDRGSQVLVLRKGHYLRLEDVQEIGMRIDDPASIGTISGGRDWLIPWDLANELAFFRAFHVFRR